MEQQASALPNPKPSSLEFFFTPPIQKNFRVRFWESFLPKALLKFLEALLAISVLSTVTAAFILDYYTTNVEYLILLSARMLIATALIALTYVLAKLWVNDKPELYRELNKFIDAYLQYRDESTLSDSQKREALTALINFHHNSTTDELTKLGFNVNDAKITRKKALQYVVNYLKEDAHEKLKDKMQFVFALEPKKAAELLHELNDVKLSAQLILSFHINSAKIIPDPKRCKKYVRDFFGYLEDFNDDKFHGIIIAIHTYYLNMYRVEPSHSSHEQIRQAILLLTNMLVLKIVTDVEKKSKELDEDTIITPKQALKQAAIFLAAQAKSNIAEATKTVLMLEPKFASNLLYQLSIHDDESKKLVGDILKYAVGNQTDTNNPRHMHANIIFKKLCKITKQNAWQRQNFDKPEKPEKPETTRVPSYPQRFSTLIYPTITPILNEADKQESRDIKTAIDLST